MGITEVEKDYFKNKKFDVNEKKEYAKFFVRLYGKEVLVHSLRDSHVFIDILKSKKLLLPKDHNSSKKTPLMERILGFENSLYFSPGFYYSIDFNFDFSLIFDIGFLKELEYYSSPLIWSCYKEIVDYWYENDKEYLEELANKNQLCREVVNKYYKTDAGSERVSFDFWRIEEIVFNHIMKYKDKNALLKIIEIVKAKYYLKFPDSLKHAKEIYFEGFDVAEVISNNEICLDSNPHFIGFEIKSKVTNEMKKILKLFSNQNLIIFDGKKIKRISEL